jgi:hypothetical protein
MKIEEQRLEKLYPWIDWREPLPLRVSGWRSGYACRFCIALLGYRPADGFMPGFSEEKATVSEHIAKAHMA